MPTVRWKDNPKEYQRQWYQEHKAEQNAKSRAWAKQHPDRLAVHHRKYKFGLLEHEQHKVLAQPCQICGNKATHIDHDHATGFVRGGLCRTCNAGLGMFRDNPKLLSNASEYVRERMKNDSHK
jgi:recombination endonuclease VII